MMLDGANIELQNLAEKLTICTRCELSQTRESSIPGYGRITADIMIVGAAVPHYLASHGRPFVGATGNTVRQLLNELGIEEERVYLTNIVKCPLPQQNSSSQDPSQKQIQACAYWLDEELRIMKPRIVVTLGVPALQRFFPGESVSSFQKQAPVEREGITYFALHHPANFQRGGQGPFASWEIEPLRKLREYVSRL
jgi:uracil-DNA glycosylase family 4